MQDTEERTMVELSFPPQPRLVRMARLAVGALAAIGGADVDRIDDVKIAVDEMCAALIEASDGSVVELSFVLGGGRLDLHGRTSAATSFALDEDRFALSRQILRAVADRQHFVVVDDCLEVSLVCPIGPEPDGV